LAPANQAALDEIAPFYSFAIRPPRRMPRGTDILHLRPSTRCGVRAGRRVGCDLGPRRVCIRLLGNL